MTVVILNDARSSAGLTHSPCTDVASILLMIAFVPYGIELIRNEAQEGVASGTRG